MRGRVTPKAAGQKVVLQQRVGNKKTWKATGTAKIKTNGTYVLKDDPSTPGQARVPRRQAGLQRLRQGLQPDAGGRGLRLAEARLPRGRAPTTNLAVHRRAHRDRLLRQQPGDRASPAPPSSIEYTLGRKCLELRATYALTDSSATGSSGAVTVSTDGAVLRRHPLSVGTVVADSVLDIEDAFRLKFDLTTSATPAAVAAVATPEVLCTR